MMNDFDWLSMLLYRECNYGKLSLAQQQVISKTYYARKPSIRIVRALFKLSTVIRSIGNQLLKSRIKSKLSFNHKYRHDLEWWA